MRIAHHLKRIYDSKQEELAAELAAVPLDEMRSRARDAPPTRDFLKALTSARTEVHIIAELKKASPSRGPIRDDYSPIPLAKAYMSSGASAISVLTERKFFQGDPSHLQEIRPHVKAPILRKDFLFHPWQIAESRAIGADAVLLIVGMLEDALLEELAGLIHDHGMIALYEIHTHDELQRVPKDALLVGVNNRNLETFDVDLNVSSYLIPLAEMHGPPNRIIVAESGIRTRQDVLFMQQAGAEAILIGEFLMSQKDVGQGIKELLGLSY